jgi:hypothetical protein
MTGLVTAFDHVCVGKLSDDEFLSDRSGISICKCLPQRIRSNEDGFPVEYSEAQRLGILTLRFRVQMVKGLKLGRNGHNVADYYCS